MNQRCAAPESTASGLRTCFFKEINMDKYVCPCGYEYDPELGDPDNGIQPGTRFEDLPEDWVCPVCGLSKDEFEKE